MKSANIEFYPSLRCKYFSRLQLGFSIFDLQLATGIAAAAHWSINIVHYVIINYVRNRSNVNLLTRWNSNYNNKDCRYVDKGCIFMIIKYDILII